MSFKRHQKFEISRLFSVLLIKLGIVLLFYFLSRLLFLLFNHQLLLEQSRSMVYWLTIFLGGIRFDLVSVFVVNLPFLIFSLLPFRFTQRTTYRKINNIVFYYIPNIIAFSADYIDMVYSRFTQKRMTFDVFRFIDAGDGFTELIPQFLSDFWYVFVVYLVMMVLFVGCNRLIIIKEVADHHSTIQFAVSRFFLLIFTMAVSVIAIRGGFQLRPIGIITASHYADPQHYMLVLNTPFTLIKTMDDVALERKTYFEEKELKRIYQPIYYGHSESPQRADNVVIIILEGVTAEYSALLNPKLDSSFTPQLDAIARQGLLVKTYANGTRSMEGIPAVLAGMPTLMDNEYITSSYADNQITSLPLVLKKHGYQSAFFHGGKNGTMNFDSFTDMAGFDHYFGKDEYNNDADYDGTWGIFDEKFLHYFSAQLDTFSNPFFASIFLLSSHHPYTLPDTYRTQFSVQEQNMKTAVRYSDWALGEFFKEASQKAWFPNTLFVIVSDHASKSDDAYYNTPIGKYEIPMIWYHPSATMPTVSMPFAQQIDVMPSVLDFLHVADTVFSLGQTIFGQDTSKAFAVNYLNHSYQMITPEFVLEFDGSQVSNLFLIQEDMYLQNNVLNQIPTPMATLDLLKAFIQTYNSSLIDNKLTIERYDE